MGPKSPRRVQLSTMRVPFHLIAASGVAFLGACATTPEVDPVATQLSAHEQELQVLQAAVTRLQATVDGIGAAGIGSTVTDMEQDLRSLRGELESLRYELRDMQQRRRSVAPGTGAAPPAPATSSSTSSQSSTRLNNSDDQAAYLAAFGELKSGQYAEAVAAFQKFLVAHPSSAYAPNAQYWIGEAYYVQKNWDEAWTAFDTVRTQYSDSLKAADALFKQGLIRIDQGRISQARTIFQEVTAKHAGSSAARLAAERLQRMGGS